MLFLLYLIIVLAVIILCLLVQLEIEIKILLKEGSNYSFIALRVFRGILRFRINLSIEKPNEDFYSLILRKTDSKLDKKTSLKEVFKLFNSNYKFFVQNIDIIKYILSKIKVSNISLNLEIGTGDAAETAIISGAVIFIFSAIQSYVINRYSSKPQPIRILPYFETKVFNMDLNCIIHLRIGHIIIAGIRIIGRIIKGGDRIGGTSH